MNQAVDVIAKLRTQLDPQIKDYMEKRDAEGQS